MKKTTKELLIVCAFGAAWGALIAWGGWIMSEKFTKGPWFGVDGDRFSKEVIITNDERTDSGIVPICEMDIYYNGIIGKEQQANAYLIAAAPDMYKFLKDIASGNGVDYPIEQLLAKARGEL